MLARGSLARRPGFFGSTHTIHLLDNVGNPPLPLRPVLDSRISRTTIEIKECVSGEEYALMRKLSKTCNSGLLVESTFQQLQTTSIMTLIVVIHREIMSTYVPSQKVKYLKGHYGLVESKVIGFQGESSGLRQRLDQISPWTRWTYMGSTATLVVRIV